MNATEFLEEQHREVEQLTDEFHNVDEDRQLEIARSVISKLRAHTTIEEEIFYPAVRRQVPSLEDQILEDLEEHHAVEMLLDELEGMTPSDERFEAKFEVISELVEHHVEEEEDELFPEVREEMDEGELATLGEQLEQRFEELMSATGADGATKEELYEQARELEIDGRSSMSKRQLADAVRNAS